VRLPLPLSNAHTAAKNGTLTRTADRVKLGVRNTRTASDWTIINQTLIRFYTLMEFNEKSSTTLSTHLHGRFPSTEERDGWIGQFSHNARRISGRRWFDGSATGAQCRHPRAGARTRRCPSGASSSSAPARWAA